jgi:hypothetical protein
VGALEQRLELGRIARPDGKVRDAFAARHLHQHLDVVYEPPVLDALQEAGRAVMAQRLASWVRGFIAWFDGAFGRDYER